jgi:hypothetical protein
MSVTECELIAVTATCLLAAAPRAFPSAGIIAPDDQLPG